MKNFTNGTEWKRGIADEAAVITWLRELFPTSTITESTADDNVNNGIDGYINGISFDVKSQKYKPYYKGFCFEMDVFYTHGNSRGAAGWHEKGGWFYRSKAEMLFYLIEEADGSHTLYEVLKSRCVPGVFDYSKTLSRGPVDRQRQNGHNVIDARSEYILYENYHRVGRKLDSTWCFNRYRQAEVEDTSRIFQRPITKADRAVQVKRQPDTSERRVLGAAYKLDA
jgi:hypothetical protein